MRKRFVFEREDVPGEAWLARFHAGRAEAERWYLGDGQEDPPTASECRSALRDHMPEILAHYDRACDLVGDDDLARCILSHYRPPPVVPGCTQAVWLGEGGPALVRNYDWHLDGVSSRFEITAWFDREVIAKAQRPWGGCIDGMNADGLVASLTFGGDRTQGRGFSIILGLRYVLETCSRVDEAIKALKRIPIAMAQNVTVLDRTGDWATLFLGPDREPAATSLRVCANHQESEGCVPGSFKRQQAALSALDDPGMTLDALTAKFLEPPLLVRHPRATTVYTAVYRPAEGRVDYVWPGTVVSQSFGRFEVGEYTHDYTID